MTKDTKAILQELKAVRTLLDVVVKRTALKERGKHHPWQTRMMLIQNEII